MKILIVEDQASILELLKLALKDALFEVEEARDGIRALNLAQNKKYQAIILDIMLPKKSGFEVIQTLRATNNNTPIIVISARDSLEDRILALNLGADDYLVKDFAVKELEARIKSMIRRSNHQAKNTFYYQDLSLNMSDLVVKRAGKEVQLTRKEFAILLELLRSKEKIVSTQELIDSVWDNTGSHRSNKLNVHIKSLRDKIDAPFENHLIQTVRGFGYRLRLERI